MHRAVILGVFFSIGSAVAQTAGPLPASPNPIATYALSHPPLPSPLVETALAAKNLSDDDLPDSPGTVQMNDAVVVGKTALHDEGKGRTPPCNLWSAMRTIYYDPRKMDQTPPRCSELVYPYQRFLDTNVPIPLSSKQKGYLAVHYTADPASVGIIVGIAAINIAADSHTAYGPGWKGFGGLAGVSLLQNATAEFFGTYAIPSLAHQDPRYFRQPNKPFKKRILYALSRSYISRSDDGHTIPNYSVFATYPIIAELGNLYVPGIQSDGASTAKRILTGYALDPVNNLVNEFLPDMASHIHVRIIFFQQILNNIAVSGNGPM